MRQYQGIGQAMGDTVLATQLMRDRMHIAHVDLVDRQTGIVSTHGHAFAGGNVGTIAKGGGQVVENQLHPHARILQPGIPLPDTNVGLNGVGQRVHSGGGSDMRWQPGNQLCIQGHYLRQQGATGNNTLFMGDGVGNNSPHSSFRTRTRSGGNDIQRQHIMLHFAKPHPVCRVVFTGSRSGDNLCSVDG